MMATSDKKMQSTDCPVCHEKYSDPKILPCAHLLCRKCLVSWMKTKIEALCPLCRSDIVDPKQSNIKNCDAFADLLPTDHAMSAMVENLKILSEKHVCHVHYNVDAISLCLHCNVKLCQGCIEVHRKFPLTRFHDMEDLATLTPERLAANRQASCSVHPDKTADFICMNHNVLICHLCVTTKHRACSEVTYVSEVSRKYKQSLLEMENKLSTAESSLTKAITELEERLLKAEKSTNAALAEIDSTCDSLLMSVETCRKRLKKLVTEENDKMKAVVHEQKSILSHKHVRVASHQGIIKRVLQMANDNILKDMVTNLESRINDLDSSLPQDTQSFLNVNLEIVRGWISQLEKELNKVIKPILSFATGTEKQCTEEEVHTDYETKQTDETELKDDLHQTMTELFQTKAELHEIKTELHATKTELDVTKAELQRTKTELQHIRNAYTLEQEKPLVLSTEVSLLKSECQKCLDLGSALEKEAKAKASFEKNIWELRVKAQLSKKVHRKKLEMKITVVRLEDLDKTELHQVEIQTLNALRDGLEFQIYKMITGSLDEMGCSDTVNTKASSTLKDISRSTEGNFGRSTSWESEIVEFKEDTLKSGTKTSEDMSSITYSGITISGIANENDQMTAPHFSDSWQMSATFTNQGGQLKGKHSDVVLYVPENAIRASTDVTIHGAVSTDLEAVHKALSLDKTETIVSPIAEYSLGGAYTGFTKALWVILPHFLTKSYSLECVRVYRFNKSTSGLFTLQRLQPQYCDVDKAAEKFDEQSEYFFVMDDKRICAVVSHFSGFFCTQCRRDLEPFQLELSLYGIHRQRNNIEVNIALFVWDGRLQIKDFEKTFLRGQFKDLKYITNGQLDPAPNEKEISLGMEMVMSASTKKAWRHLEMEGNQVSPTATKRRLENVYVQSDCRSHTLNQLECSHQYTDTLCNNCFYNRKPIRIDWTLEGKQGATPTAWFQCAIRVGYIRAFNPTSLNFLEEVMLQTLNVHGLEVEEKVNAGVQTDLGDSVETHVQKLAEAPAAEETRSQLIEDASYQADNQHAVMSSIPNTAPTSVVNVNINAFHGQLDLSSNTKLRALLSTDEEAHQMAQPPVLSSLVRGMRENLVSSSLEQNRKSLFVSSGTEVPDAEETHLTRPTLHDRRAATPSREAIQSSDFHTVGGQGAACRNLGLLSTGSGEQRLHSTPTQFHTTFDTTGDNYRETSMSGLPIGHDVTSLMTNTNQTTLLKEKESTKDDDGNVIDEAVNVKNDPQI